MATKEEELEKLLESIDFKNLTAEQITGKDGLLKLLTKKIIENDLPPKGVPLIEGKSLAKIKQIMQEIMYEKETIYRRTDPRDTEGIRSWHTDPRIVPQIRHKQEHFL